MYEMGKQYILRRTSQSYKYDYTIIENMASKRKEIATYFILGKRVIL